MLSKKKETEVLIDSSVWLDDETQEEPAEDKIETTITGKEGLLKELVVTVQNMRGQYRKYLYGSLLIISGVGLACVFRPLDILPVCILAVTWILVLTGYKSRLNILTAAAGTILLGLYSWLGGSIIAGLKAPAGQRINVLNLWLNTPFTTARAMLSGIDLTGFGHTVREIWLINLWLVPLAAIMARLFFKGPGKGDEKLTLHGSSHFIEPKKANLLNHREGFILGREKKRGGKEVVLPLKEVCEHVLIDGAPGAGKSASIFIPNLLRIAENGGYANIVVTDPKMELLSICGPLLQKAGYTVLVYHPFAPEISHGWNMLYYAGDFDAVDDMVMTIITNTNAGGKSESYWEQQTNTLLDLICYYLRETLGERATMNHVQAIAGAAGPDSIEATLKNSKNKKIRLNANGFFAKISGNPRVLSSIMSDLPRRLKLWTIGPVRATTSKNEIDFTRLCSVEKVALFVVTPMDKKEQLKPLLATFFSQLFKEVQEKGRKLGKLPRPLWFLLDEFANLGTIPGFDNFLTVVRGYRAGVVMGIQSISQLEELYGKNRAQTIVDACANYIVFPRIGLNDAGYFSAMMGLATIQTVNKSYQRRLFHVELGYRETETAVKRDLMSPDEIRSLQHGENLIVICGTRRPVLIKPAMYYLDPRWRNLGKECGSEKALRLRRSVFSRRLNNKEPLEIPDEDQMLAEASFNATAPVAEKVNHKQNPGQLPEPREKSIKNGIRNAPPRMVKVDKGELFVKPVKHSGTIIEKPDNS